MIAEWVHGGTGKGSPWGVYLMTTSALQKAGLEGMSGEEPTFLSSVYLLEKYPFGGPNRLTIVPRGVPLNTPVK